MQEDHFYLIEAIAGLRRKTPNLISHLGGFDGTEVFELVGLYLININVAEISEESISLYGDYDLSCSHYLFGLEKEKVKKRLCKVSGP